MVVDVSTRGGPAQVTTMPSKSIITALALLAASSTKASEASAKLSADSAVSALEATKLILARAESLEASREAVPDDAKKAASLDGF